MPLPAARIGDMHVCPLVNPGPVPHVGGPIAMGCPTVIIGGMPAARVGDTCVCVGPPDAIAMGSTSVLIGGSLAARITDPTVHGGKIVMGCPTVLIEPGEHKQTSDEEESQGGAAGDGGEGGDATTSESYGGLGNVEGEPVDAQLSQEGLDINSTGISQTGENSFSIGLDAEPTGMASVPSLGSQIMTGAGQGFGDAFTSLGSSIADTARGAFSLATSQDARNAAFQQAGATAAALGQAAQNPVATAQLAGQAAQNAWNGYQNARNDAYKNGLGPQFDAKTAGRLAGEAVINAAPGLGGIRKAEEAVSAARMANLANGAREAGITESTALKLNAIATKTDSLIEMRPTNPGAKELIEAGHSPKPEMLKMKTANDLDKQLGLPADVKNGEVAYFKPQMPDTAGMSPQQAQKLQARFDQRTDEWKSMRMDVKTLQSQGKIELQNGVVKDTRGNPLTNKGFGKSFTGDNDVFGIRNADGSAASEAKKAAVMKELRRSDVGVEHGALKDWNTGTDRKYAEMKDKMIKAHMPESAGGGGEPLVGFGPNGAFKGFGQ